MLASPVPLGPFLVEEDGRLTYRGPNAQPAFGFQWRNRRFAVRLQANRLVFTVSAGRVPSTAGGADRRHHALALLAALRRVLPPAWSLSLTPGHVVQLQAEQSMTLPATVSDLLWPVIALTLSAAPALDLLEENGLA